ncbi:hypothetical protein K1719_016192 [Acacia pycnantha]|nr:hypothetical protein K1719_016192 [Acacia pycnantha]
MESNAGSSSEMNSNQTCNACQTALADLNILKMNVSLLNSQCSSSIQSLFSSIAHLNQQVETLFRRIEKLEGNGKRNVSTADSAIQTDLELSPLNESYTQIGSSTQAQTRNGSSTQENVSGPTAQTLQTITPFNEIIKTQMQEEACRKEKGKIVEASTSIPRITRSKSFDTHSKYLYFKTLVSKTGNMEISDPHVKYASHFAFNKVVAYPGTSPDLIRILYQYGMLHAIYIPNNPEPTEIKELPALQEAVKIYVGVVTQHSVYIRFYSTVAEITPEKFYPPISLIRLGTTKKPIETEAEIKEDIEDDQEFQNKMYIRAQNYHVIFQEMTRAIKSEKQWVYYCGMTSIIAAFGKTSHDQPLFVQWCKNCEEREKAM